MHLPDLVNELPDNFLTSCLRAVYLGRKQGWDQCAAEFAPTEARNVRPFYARGKIEGLLRGVADRTAGCTAVTITESSWSHVELRFKHLTITCHSVPAAGAMVDVADYRVNLAAMNEPRLFEVDAPKETSRVYAVLTHSSYQGRLGDDGRDGRHLPGSVHLGFPVAGLTRYAHQVNLLDRHPDVVRANLPAEWNGDAPKIDYYFWQARQRTA